MAVRVMPATMFVRVVRVPVRMSVRGFVLVRVFRSLSL